MLSVLPRFVVLEMINDMTNVEDEHLQHQFHRIYIHRYENVRWGCTDVTSCCDTSHNVYGHWTLPVQEPVPRTTERTERTERTTT